MNKHMMNAALAILILLVCACSAAVEPVDSGQAALTCSELCELLPARVCSPHVTTESCAATCEANEAEPPPCWPELRAAMQCVALVPAEACVDQDAECLQERAELERCWHPTEVP